MSQVNYGCFRRCSAAGDRKQCADESGLSITNCLCECHSVYTAPKPPESDAPSRLEQLEAIVRELANGDFICERPAECLEIGEDGFECQLCGAEAIVESAIVHDETCLILHARELQP